MPSGDGQGMQKYLAFDAPIIPNKYNVAQLRPPNESLLKENLIDQMSLQNVNLANQPNFNSSISENTASPQKSVGVNELNL